MSSVLCGGSDNLDFSRNGTKRNHQEVRGQPSAVIFICGKTTVRTDIYTVHYRTSPRHSMRADGQAGAGNHYGTTYLWVGEAVEVDKQGGKDPGVMLTSYRLSLGW